MNGLPSWLLDLAEARPASVERVLRECIVGEWNYPPGQSHVYGVLSDLSWEGGNLARLVRPTVVEQLANRDPAHPVILHSALSLVLKTASLPDNELSAIALSRCLTTPLTGEAFARWAAAALQLDAETAIATIVGRLEQSGSAEQSMSEINGFLSPDLGTHLTLLPHPSYLRARSLRQLIPLVYRYVRPAEDVVRKTGVSYSPNRRDGAQRFRDALLSRLAQSDEPEAGRLLRELLSASEVAAHRDWILHLLDDRAIRDANLQEWEPADIRQFVLDHETKPKSDADLFRIIVNRLSDIKHDVESSDNSLREEVANGSDEYVLRRWLARKLAERSRDRYTIPQEEEIDQEERPDIRAEHPETWPVSIEVKWADRWTLEELLERLETQLVGQYLRSHESRYGIYILGMQGSKGHWKGARGHKLVFHEVVEAVSERARQLSASHPSVEEICVTAIDFRRPAEREPVASAISSG
jgi:hypothetical protein